MELMTIILGIMLWALLCAVIVVSASYPLSLGEPETGSKKRSNTARDPFAILFEE